MQTTTLSVGNKDQQTYNQFLTRLQQRFDERVAGKNLFTTDVDLYPAYLDHFSPELRQEHTCHACRQFIQRFGNLVIIDDAGNATSAMWNEGDAPVEYRASVSAMRQLVSKAKVVGVFVSSEKIYGYPKTGNWVHLSLVPEKARVYKKLTTSPDQYIAAKTEDFKNIHRALNEFELGHLVTATKILQSASIYRGEKVFGQAQWLYELKLRIGVVRGECKKNIIWDAIAAAPDGYCHPRSGVLGTLLEDIALGLEFNEIAAKFNAKMNPTQYQRPQAAPHSATVAQAEEIIKKLGAEKSLERRFAQLEDITTLWLPKTKVNEQPKSGIFGEIQVRDIANSVVDMKIPPLTMTFSKFLRDVMLSAESIQIRAPSHGAYTSLLTAVHKDSPPILQWDDEVARNQVSWYVWSGGSHSNQFGLTAGKWYDLTAISLKPNMWFAENKHHGKGAVFIIKGAAETRQPSLGLFPEILRSEFHSIRSVIESYSRSKVPEDFYNQSAAGFMANEGQQWDVHLRVVSKGQTVDYILDRWE